MKKLLAILVLVLAFLMLDGCAVPPVELPAPGTAPSTEPVAAVAVTEPPATEIQTTPVTEIISREEAIAIALEHAGFTADQVSRLECEFDGDDPVKEYEVDFHQGKYEYSYDIHAETGQILFSEKEIDD